MTDEGFNKGEGRGNREQDIFEVRLTALGVYLDIEKCE